MSLTFCDTLHSSHPRVAWARELIIIIIVAIVVVYSFNIGEPMITNRTILHTYKKYKKAVIEKSSGYIKAPKGN